MTVALVRERVYRKKGASSIFHHGSRYSPREGLPWSMSLRAARLTISAMFQGEPADPISPREHHARLARDEDQRAIRATPAAATPSKVTAATERQGASIPKRSTSRQEDSTHDHPSVPARTVDAQARPARGSACRASPGHPLPAIAGRPHPALLDQAGRAAPSRRRQPLGAVDRGAQ